MYQFLQRHAQPEELHNGNYREQKENNAQKYPGDKQFTHSKLILFKSP